MFVLLTSIIGFTSIPPEGDVTAPVVSGSFPHALLDSVQRRYVDGAGRVDYARLRDNPDNLDRYYRLLATYSPDSHSDLFPTEVSRLAYWINAYNAAVLKTVLEYYPIATVSDVEPPKLLFFMSDRSGFFYFQKLEFGGEEINLYDLEHDIVRKRFADPRIHFALNCASLGCPRLPQRAFSAENLEAELESETRRFVNEERNVRIDHEQQVIHLSSIFSWYDSDFLDWYGQRYPKPEPALLDYISLYLPSEKAAGLTASASYEIRVIPYDWGLNDQADD